jgi:putative ABC transport system substrate-binding protein
MKRRMKRRDFVGLMGCAAAWPMLARAQSVRPVIGYMSIQPISDRPTYIEAFRAGLSSQGFVDGQNLTIEFRSANGNLDQLPKLAAGLVQDGVAVIVSAGGAPAALAAQHATETIPIVFVNGGDPVHIGLVSNFSHPDKNLTGVYFQLPELVAKRMALFHELLPGAKRIAILVNPTNTEEAEPSIRNATDAARTLGLDIEIFNARTIGEIDTGFAAIAKQRFDALFVSPDPLFGSQAKSMTAAAARYALPTSYFLRDFVTAGGLMSYGPSNEDSHRQLGVYAGRILKGEKVGELPVMQPTKYDLVVNLRTLKALNLEIPATLLARADEVIE